ncbi:CRISPR-associated helicase Cas3' [Planctomycetota bacterium]
MLVDHLVSVAHAAGSSTGSTHERLGFLAGLLHDAAKCHEEWQDYIQPSSARKKGPPHSPMGAALFAFVAEHLLKQWHTDRKELQAARDRMLNWLMAISGHHGRLGDFGGQLIPWMKVGNRYSVNGLIAGCDLCGVFDLVAVYFPEFDREPREFEPWLQSYDRRWLKLAETNRTKQLEQAKPNEVAMRYPFDFSSLIIADRIHAGGIPDDVLQPQDIESAIHVHQTYCDQQAKEALAKGASPEMVSLRNSIQRQSLRNFKDSIDDQFYTLLLPTGYGKTLTSLRIALEACKSAKRRRIIYVAPYLSILSQATIEIQRATGIDVFQHHHLSLAATVSNDDTEPTNSEQPDSDDDFELLDTWKTPVLSTTFNQFFRALFPSRAQQTLRIDAVKRSFVIIDEPQIIDVNVWNVFLRALSVFAIHHDCQILFTTATLPPMRLGLETDETPLAPNVQSQHRYDIVYSDQPYDPDRLAQEATSKLGDIGNAAIVLNTVRDAANVFGKVETLCDKNTRVFCLTAMMLPSHKHRTIKQIGDFLKRQREGTETSKLIVVCTQMLEAGVDLSFRQIWRARSILPSVAQVAGRGNRHGEGERAKIFVFPLHSRDDVELRRWVYRDPTARTITDSIFASHSVIPETETRQRLDEYYDQSWAQNNQLARTKLFETAALGQWSCLAGVEPFGFSPPREEIFVPVPLSQLDDRGRNLVQRFTPDAGELMDRYQDGAYRHTFSFRERKLFQIAIQQFIVPTRADIAEKIATKLNDWLWKIDRLEDYSTETGLAHWLVGEESENGEQSVNPIF